MTSEEQKTNRDQGGKPHPLEIPPPDIPPEHGGRKGPEPTRFGDWEISGKCVDF